MRIIRQLVLATLAGAGTLKAQQPSLTGYLMPRDSEIALAKSAAPAGITDRATIKVFTGNSYEVAREGDNGFVCLVLRGWSAPTFSPAQFRDFVHASAIRAPICYNPVAARTVLPYQELLGGNAFGGPFPFLSDDAGTPFAVTVIPVDHQLAIHVR
jgi:hypothetical protein